MTDDDPRQLGPYQLLGRLVEGEMGRVYLGRSPGGRTVAVKMVPPDLARAPGFRERFACEVRISQTVWGGQGAVPVMAWDADAPEPWLATLYVSATTLDHAVREHGPLPEATLWRLLAGLAEALAAVHGNGLVHRDLKPSNVLLSLDGPLLIDFGIARAADDRALTGTGPVAGLPGFMSPEQAEGRAIDAASDVFSLGAVLVYAATGHGPFDGGAGHSMIFRVMYEEPDLTGVPEGFAAVVAACLAKAPGDRPSPEALRDQSTAMGEDDADWLPIPVASTIARKAEQLLNLEAAGPGRPSPESREAALLVTQLRKAVDNSGHSLLSLAELSGYDHPELMLFLRGQLMPPWDIVERLLTVVYTDRDHHVPEHVVRSWRRFYAEAMGARAPWIPGPQLLPQPPLPSRPTHKHPQRWLERLRQALPSAWWRAVEPVETIEGRFPGSFLEHGSAPAVEREPTAPLRLDQLSDRAEFPAAAQELAQGFDRLFRCLGPPPDTLVSACAPLEPHGGEGTPR